VVKWKSTVRNHTGMFYFAKRIKRQYPYFTQVITISELDDYNNKLFFYRIIKYIIAYYLQLIAKRNDKIFLMEYLFPWALEQSYFARKLHNKAQIVALAHLIPRRINESYTDNDLKDNVSFVDKLFVFGNSLKNFYIQKGVPVDKVVKIYHYVDNKYYRVKHRDIKKKNPLIVIFMGNVERNYEDLFEIVKVTSDIQYHICRGLNSALDNRCLEFSNVQVHKNIKESELRNLMHKSDVSLNVMHDTVGSNVIVTSLSCGLAMVCSDVGSIRDYVPEDAGILFNNVQEAVEGLRRLNNDRQLLYKLQIESLKKAEQIDIIPLTKQFCSMLTLI
jgi:glycosyltransferase involved in cell wall biosynthesis